MNSRRIYISGVGHQHAAHVIKNSFFDTLDIGSSNDWVEERTGIRSRTSVLSESTIADLRFGRKCHADLFKNNEVTKIADLANNPWEMALSRTQDSVVSKGVDTVICGTSIPDYDIPANACGIAAKLQLEATAFDVNSACSSFVTGMHVARSLLLSKLARRIALFNVERYSTRMDYTDRRNCILFGDGAAAAILESGAEPHGLEIIDTVIHSAPSGFEHVQIPEGGLFYQNGQVVQKFAITKTCAIAEEILAANSLSIGDIDFFIGHQANLRMLATAIRRLGLPEEKHLYNVDRCGNQGAAGAPCVISENWDRFAPGNLILVAVVGAGLTWGAALLRRC
jgi:3-oxoacyl-[acyl-carrier-protein] synthase-3